MWGVATRQIKWVYSMHYDKNVLIRQKVHNYSILAQNQNLFQLLSRPNVSIHLSKFENNVMASIHYIKISKLNEKHP